MGRARVVTTTGFAPPPSGNRAQSKLPTADLFRCRGGHILLAVNNEKQFKALSKAIGHPDLGSDPRFKDWPSRIANEGALRGIIEDVLAAHDAATWDEKLTAQDVPCSRIWTIPEVVEHPQLGTRAVLQTIDSPDGPLRLVEPGFRLAHGGGTVHAMGAAAVPRVGPVLREAGYSGEEIEQLRASGAVSAGLR